MVLILCVEPDSLSLPSCLHKHLHRNVRNLMEIYKNQGQGFCFFEPDSQKHFLLVLYQRIFAQIHKICWSCNALCHSIDWFLRNDQVQGWDFLYRWVLTELKEPRGSFRIEKSGACTFVFGNAVSSSWRQRLRVLVPSWSWIVILGFDWHRLVQCW